MASKHATIADALIEDILSGRYRPGERLPSERDLAARFGANRGAVREAMKRLEQLGLALIGPGGARVNELPMGSLDVVGYLLARGDRPDSELVLQVLKVIHALFAVAADAVVRNASHSDIARLRDALKPLINERLRPEERQQARIVLLSDIMLTSGNLICQIIARTLFEQLTPRVTELLQEASQKLDRAAYIEQARRLDEGLAARDAQAVRSALEIMSEINRDTIMQTLNQEPQITARQAIQ